MEREERIALRTPLDASYRAAANVKSRRRLGLEPRRALWRDVKEDFLALRCRVRLSLRVRTKRRAFCRGPREGVVASVGRRREGEAKVEAEDYSAIRLNRALPALDSSAEQG